MSQPKPVYSSRRTEDLAYVQGLDGQPAPEWVKSDVRFFSAYKRGLDHRAQQGQPAQPAPSSPPPSPRPPRSASRAGRRLAKTRPANNTRRPYLTRAFSPAAAANRLGASRVMRAGDGGGLLLALVIYPLFLATVQHGAKGPGMWFRAKWLNDAPGDSGTGGPAVHSQGDPNSPHPVPGRLYYKIDPKTGKYYLVDSNGHRIAGAPETTRMPPGGQMYPSAGGTPA